MDKYRAKILLFFVFIILYCNKNENNKKDSGSDFINYPEELYNIIADEEIGESDKWIDFKQYETDSKEMEGNEFCESGEKIYIEENTRIISFIAAKDGSYIGSGRSNLSNGLLGKAWMFALDSSYKFKCSKTFLSDNLSSAFYIEEGADGLFTLGACRKESWDSTAKLWIFNIDDKCDVSNEQPFPSIECSAVLPIIKSTEAIKILKDGGILIVSSYVGQEVSNTMDIGAVKIKHGVVEWVKKYEKTLNRLANNILDIEDGFILSGHSIGIEGIFGESQQDYMIFKIDEHGEMLWYREYGDSGTDELHHISASSDGGFIVTGLSNSFFILKTDDKGNEIWKKGAEYNGLINASGNFVFQDKDEGYLITGRTSNANSIFGMTDIFVLKIDKIGNFVWLRIFGGEGDDEGVVVVENDDGTYTVAGNMLTKGVPQKSSVWIATIDKNGNMVTTCK